MATASSLAFGDIADIELIRLGAQIEAAVEREKSHADRGNRRLCMG
jgi:hypothetical protein